MKQCVQIFHLELFEQNPGQYFGRVIGLFAHRGHPVEIDVLSAGELVFSSRDALYLQPHRRDPVDLVAERFGHIVASRVPRRYIAEDVLRELFAARFAVLGVVFQYLFLLLYFLLSQESSVLGVGTVDIGGLVVS